MKEEKIYFENQSEEIEGILYLPEKKTNKLIILVHGFTSTREGAGGSFLKLAEKLTLNDFVVLVFNFRYTTDDFKNFHQMTIKGEVSDLKLIIEKMVKKYSKIGLVGESLGAVISTLSYDERIKCLVFWYPCVFLKETSLVRNFLSKEALEELEKTGFLIGKKSDGREYKIGKELVEELRTIEIIPFIKNIHSPILIIHGTKDTIVPFSHSEKLLNFLKEPKKLEKIEGICHGWRNKDFSTDYNFKAQEKAVRLTVEWFKQWLK